MISQSSDLLDVIQSDPIFFIENILGVETLEEYQVRVAEAVLNYERVSIKACHSVGKTWLMARLALWFLNSFAESKIITTAPTYLQVEALLWGELRAAYKKSKYPLGGNLTRTKLELDDQWFALGFSPKKEAGSDSSEQIGSNFQGFHAEYIAVIFDEATGIPPDIWRMAEGLLTSGAIVKFICIGNPTTRNCEFFKTFSSVEWYNISLSCFDSPNLIANGIVNKKCLEREIRKIKEMSNDEALSYIASYKKPVPYLLSAQWVVSKALDWGMTHPLMLSKAFAEFPKNEDNVIVQFGDVELAIGRERSVVNKTLKCIGVDVARYGDDKTVFTEIIDNVVTRVRVLYKRDTSFVTGEFIQFLFQGEQCQETRVLVDCTGIGAGVFDGLNEAQEKSIIPGNVELYEIHFGGGLETDEDKRQFSNLKAKMFFLLGTDVKVDLALPNEDVYTQELPTIKYKFDSKGRMIIESKEDYKKRTGRNSPDHSDSLALANFGRHVNAVIGEFSKNKAEKEKTSYDARRVEKRIKVSNY